MKETRFEVNIRVTRESCRALARARSSQHIRVIWLCNTAIALGVLILWAVDSRDAVWLTVLLAVLVLHTVLRPYLTALRLYASRNAAVDVIRLSFSDEGIAVFSNVEESMLRYSMVTGLKEDSAYIIIFMRHHTPLVICKAELEDKVEGLKEYLKEQTGLEIRAMHK